MYEVKKNKQGKWIVIAKGNKRASKVFESKLEAISYATKKSRDEDTTFRVEDSSRRSNKLWVLLIILVLVVILVLIVLFASGKIKLDSTNKEATYTIEFEGNGHGEVLTEMNGSVLPDPLPIIENVDGFEFKGWYLDDKFEEEAKPGQTITKDTKLYAKWEKTDPTVIEDGDLSIHFLELGNYYAGDSVYIKAGDIDILIDAGSRASSSTTIHNYIKEFCTDGKLEYVIATHAHEDHISGFVGTNSNPGIFDLYECEIIIDYALKNTSSQISKNYEAKRDREVTLGAKHYTAKDCMEGTNGAKSKYTLTESISFEILDQRYYYEKSSDENNYSVCMMLNYKDNHILFTGDLEKEGEESLVELNDLPHCKVFKGGHHGSKTSSNEALLSKITPEVVCVCCCAGSSEYTDNVDNMFPTQDFINRVSKYTNRIYVTTLAKYEITTNKNGKEYPKVNGFESMNGNIVVTLDKDRNVVTTCSNNDTILKESEWFNSTIILDGVERKMRVWPSDGK
ncbi:MAG: MBL fold metallo-hydrolase [Roseburia sp.]|nr:MBL fold metallo-hydrolase [Anaeroplasma bactoclasticum]MCM1196224.1 MBL fold metallo-hydrolase [Roseburia sp.]MCM1556046.1 MBL fold metallo-hydrolase [Anaeroplasma bactoclasticum]